MDGQAELEFSPWCLANLNTSGPYEVVPFFEAFPYDMWHLDSGTIKEADTSLLQTYMTFPSHTYMTCSPQSP